MSGMISVTTDNKSTEAEKIMAINLNSLHVNTYMGNEALIIDVFRTDKVCFI